MAHIPQVAAQTSVSRRSLRLRRGRSSDDTTSDEYREVSDELLSGNIGLACPPRPARWTIPTIPWAYVVAARLSRSLASRVSRMTCSMEPAICSMTATIAGLPSGA